MYNIYTIYIYIRVFNGRPSHNGNPVHGYINRYENELMTIPQHGYKSHF